MNILWHFHRKYVWLKIYEHMRPLSSGMDWNGGLQSHFRKMLLDEKMLPNGTWGFYGLWWDFHNFQINSYACVNMGYRYPKPLPLHSKWQRLFEYVFTNKNRHSLNQGWDFTNKHGNRSSTNKHTTSYNQHMVMQELRIWNRTAAGSPFLELVIPQRHSDGIGYPVLKRNLGFLWVKGVTAIPNLRSHFGNF